MSNNTILATAPLTTTGFHIKATGTTLGNSLIWDNGTNVGIGTTSPNAPLNVVKDDGVSAGLHILADFNRNTSSAELILGYNADGTNVTTNTIYSANSLPLAFHTSAIERMRITATGNVGIGTTNPSSILTLQAPTSANPNTGGLSFKLSNGTTYFTIGVNNSTGDGSILSGAGGGITFHTNSDMATTNERMKITSAGNVGIGISAPTRNLVVQNSSTESLISIVSNPSSIAYLLFGDTAADAQGRVQYNNASDIMQIFTNGAEAIRILSNQNVGIGTGGDANSRVYIKGIDTTASNNAFLLQNNADNLMFYVRNDGVICSGTAANSPYNLVRSGRVMMVDSNGLVGYQSSTRESKTNINNLTDISFLYKLNPVSFNYRKSEDTSNIFTNEYNEDLHYGLIADEVEKVNKELVFYNEKDGVKELAGVEYGKLTAILIKAIQEQNQTIQNLQEQINILAK